MACYLRVQWNPVNTTPAREMPKCPSILKQALRNNVMDTCFIDIWTKAAKDDAVVNFCTELNCKTAVKIRRSWM